MQPVRFLFLAIVIGVLTAVPAWADIKIGLNYPETGPYGAVGLDQLRGAEMAVEEINAAGGIMGQKLVLTKRDTKSKPDIAVQNANELIDKERVSMLLGGASSGVAVAVGKVAQQKKIPFFATVASANEVTEQDAQRYMFRVCYNAWMGAKALSVYLSRNFAGKRFFYIVADYNWGIGSEESIRTFTSTTDTIRHKTVRLPLGTVDYKDALLQARAAKAEVLVMCLFGKDMEHCIRQATDLGLKQEMALAVPIIELSMAEGAGEVIMEGVIGTSDWNWQVPYKYDHQIGRAFVERFSGKYNRYPCWGASTAYSNMMKYKAAVERAHSFAPAEVVKALEGHKFALLKDEEEWRTFDHQCVQSVYLVKCKPAPELRKDRLQLDYFEILDRVDGHKIVKTRQEWDATRKAADLPFDSIGSL